MFLKRLKSASIISITFFGFFGLLFFCLPLLNHSLSEYFQHSFSHVIIMLLCGFLIPFLHSIGLNNLVYEKDVIKRNALILAPTFYLLTTPLPFSLPVWIISFLLLFYFNILLSTYQKQNPFQQVFNANFLLGTIAIYNSNILLLSPLVIFTLFFFSNLNWRSIVISCIGIGLPFFFWGTIIFIFELPFHFTTPKYHFIFEAFSFQTLQTAQIIWGIVFSIILLFAVLELIFWIYKKRIRSRSSFFVVISYLVLLLFIGINDSYYLLLTPLSVIVANYFIYAKKTRIAELLFLLLVIASFYYKISF